jgi:hypothetical protein
MPGNPIPSFAVAMMAIGMILTMGLLLEFFVAGFFGDEVSIEGNSLFYGLIGILLMLLGIWTVLDSNKKLSDHK